ncbi:MAG: helix-turn-helix transcriptional regulator, partial [Cyanobacteria bacterium P01_F01_bin.4]
RLSGFELSEDWQQTVRRRAPKRRRKHAKSTPAAPLSGSAIKAARQRQNFSQRALAERLGKSQSWVRDVESGRFSISPEDYARLHQTLGIQ